MTNSKSIEEIKTLIGRIDLIGGLPTFMNMHELEKQLIPGEKKVEYCKCKYGYAGGIMESGAL